MVSITCALYLDGLLALEYFSDFYLQSLLGPFLSFLPVVLGAIGLVLVVLVHRAYKSNFLRLRAAILSIWVACLALSSPILFSPIMALISVCVSSPKEEFDCWSFDSVNFILDLETFMISAAALASSFGVAVAFAFLYGWYLLGKNLFDMYRGKRASVPAA
jgi:hypothetical protein